MEELMNSLANYVRALGMSIPITHQEFGEMRDSLWRVTEKTREILILIREHSEFPQLTSGQQRVINEVYLETGNGTVGYVRRCLRTSYGFSLAGYTPQEEAQLLTDLETGLEKLRANLMILWS